MLGYGYCHAPAKGFSFLENKKGFLATSGLPLLIHLFAVMLWLTLNHACGTG